MTSVGKLLSFVYRLVSIPNLVCFSMVQFSCSNCNWTERSEIWCEIMCMMSKISNECSVSSIWKYHKYDFRPKLHNPKFIWINTRTTRFWLVPSYIEPVAGFSKSETRNMFTSHCENMSMSCQCYVIASCDWLFCFTVLFSLAGKKMQFRAKNSAICD